MRGKQDARRPSSKPERETEQVDEDDKKKGLNWAAASFALNLWRLMRDWFNAGE